MIKDFIDFTGPSEAAKVAIRELFPKFGKKRMLIVYVHDTNFSQYYRNKIF